MSKRKPNEVIKVAGGAAYIDENKELNITSAVEKTIVNGKEISSKELTAAEIKKANQKETKEKEM